MNRVIKTTGAVMLAGLLLGVLIVTGLVALIGAHDASPLIEINGDAVTLAHMGVGHALLAIGGVIVALLVVLFVVPVAVLVPLLIAALVLAGVLAGVLLLVAGATALVFSPLIVLAGAVWLIVRLVRGRRRGAGATIVG